MKSVTPSRTIVSMAPAASNLGCRTSVAPTRNVVFIATDCPKTWNSGRLPIVTSSRRTSLPSKAETVAFMTRLRWVSRAPFGSPVVPLV